MIVATAQPEKTGVRPPQARYGAGATAHKRRVKMGPKHPTSVPNTGWNDRIVRIRDHQDETAFAEVFNHFAPRIKGFLVNSGASPTLAEECAQETMVTLWHKAHLFDPTRASAATWIFTIARNKKIDAFRRAARPEPEELPWGPEPEPEAADALALQQETNQLTVALNEGLRGQLVGGLEGQEPGPP